MSAAARLDKHFFTIVRTVLFRGMLSQPQVDGFNAIAAAFPDDVDNRWLAYALATAYHETDQTMQPIAEYGGGLNRPYGVPAGPYSQVYYGRGYVQLTWLANYRKAAAAIPGAEALVANPDLALKPDLAAQILARGLTEGWFGADKAGPHTLERHFPLARPAVADWVGARRIVNGLDCAAKIAGHALQIHHALAPAKRA